jgi:ribonuclease VapC
MVLDTSALMAILQEENEGKVFLDTIEAASIRLLSSATLVETSMVVLARRQEAGRAIFNEFLGDMKIEIVPLTPQHAAFAVEAFRRFGKGRHPAGLNLGDCFSYALAKATGEQLLCKGDDFPRTDIARAA